MSRAQLTSTVEQNTGGAVAPYVGAKNGVANGAMDWWQRGTSAAGSYPTYLADRWMNYRSVAGSTYSRQATGDTTNLPTIQYCQRISRDSGNTATNALYISQSLESIESRRFVGQTVTLSWYARAGANFSAASSSMVYELDYGTGTDQNVIAGFTGQTVVISGNKTLTTTWQRFSVTGTISSSATQLGVNLYFIPVGTAGAADYMEITGVQLELGSVATPFSRAGGTLQGELALCQRYLPAITFTDLAQGYAYSTNSMLYSMQFPVTARVAPTGISLIGSFTATVIATNYSSVTPIFNSAQTANGSIVVTSGVTASAGQVGRFTGGTILWTGCEL